MKVFKVFRIMTGIACSINIWFLTHVFLFTFIYLCGAVDHTQGLTHARQLLYSVVNPASPCLFIFIDLLFREVSDPQ